MSLLNVVLTVTIFLSTIVSLNGGGAYAQLNYNNEMYKPQQQAPGAKDAWLSGDYSSFDSGGWGPPDEPAGAPANPYQYGQQYPVAPQPYNPMGNYPNQQQQYPQGQENYGNYNPNDNRGAYGNQMNMNQNQADNQNNQPDQQYNPGHGIPNYQPQSDSHLNSNTNQGQGSGPANNHNQYFQDTLHHPSNNFQPGNDRFPPFNHPPFPPPMNQRRPFDQGPMNQQNQQGPEKNPPEQEEAWKVNNELNPYFSQGPKEDATFSPEDERYRQEKLRGMKSKWDYDADDAKKYGGFGKGTGQVVYDKAYLTKEELLGTGNRVQNQAEVNVGASANNWNFHNPNFQPPSVADHSFQVPKGFYNGKIVADPNTDFLKDTYLPKPPRNPNRKGGGGGYEQARSHVDDNPPGDIMEGRQWYNPEVDDLRNGASCARYWGCICFMLICTALIILII